MKQRIYSGILIVVLAINLYVGTRHYLNSAEGPGKEDVYGQMHKFALVMEEVRKHYVDPEKITYENLFEAAMDGMLNKLDPHSAYLNPKKHEVLKSNTRQQFGGIGVLISIRDEWLTVIEPMEGGPSLKAGVVSGDKVIKIGDKSTKGFKIQDAVDHLRGEPGTKVTITVQRGKDTEKEIDITRAIIKTKSVRDLYGRSDFKLLEPGIGYVRITNFAGKTDAEVEAALAKQETAGMKGLILDLRDNPGGLLNQSALIAEKFIKKGHLIVSTEGRGGRQREKLVSQAANPRDLPIVVLINGGSASASEIVAGCLQDLKRAELVGMKTFGKGSVQTIFPLDDDSAIRLTTAKYYTPSHRVIHEKGIEPDHKVEMTPEQMRDMSLQRSPVGLEGFTEEDIKRIKAAKDLQLDKALELMRDQLKAQ